jgi:MFS family permease
VSSVGAAFFPQAAMKEFGMNYSQVGCIFATLPIVVGLFSRVARQLCEAFGRLPFILIGLGFQVAATAGFGFGNDFFSFVALAALSGIGTALMEVACVSLIHLNVKESDVASIVGWHETLIGLGCFIGPLSGGFVYWFYGFSVAYYVFGAFLALVWTIFLFTWFCNSSRWARLDLISKYMKNIRFGNDNNTSVKSKSCICSGRIFVGSLAILQSFFTIGAMDLILGAHLQNVLRIPSVYIGLIFAVQSLIYMGSSQFVNSKVLLQLSPKMTMFLGGILTGTAFLLIGPVPTGEEYLLKDWMMCLTNIAGLVLAQIGLACEVIPAVPMIKEAVDLYFYKHRRSMSDSRNQASESGDHDDDESDGPLSVMNDPAYANLVPSIFNISSSLGQISGPLISGLLMHYLPKRFEVFCSPDNPFTISCENGFQLTSMAISASCFLSSILVYMFIPRRRAFEEEDASSLYISFSPEEEITSKS